MKCGNEDIKGPTLDFNQSVFNEGTKGLLLHEESKSGLTGCFSTGRVHAEGLLSSQHRPQCSHN